MKLLERLVHWCQRKSGLWHTCQACDAWVKFRWEKNWVYHPDEPPMFVTYTCPTCGWSSGVCPTQLTEKAVRKLGYTDFLHYAAKNKMIPADENESAGEENVND